jgi:uncharacterized protein YjbJ (UPF0337 family)
MRDSWIWPEDLLPSASWRMVAMNWERIRGDWQQLAGKLKQTWTKLTDEDLTRIAGNRENLVEVLQQHYEYRAERAELEIDHFIHHLPS